MSGQKKEKMNRIVLASGSPRRKTLLEWAEIDFEVITSDIDETFPPHLTPEEAAIFVAREKAIAVGAGEKFRALGSDMPILAADTMVVLDGGIIGKPADRSDAIGILSRLSGRKHRVVTGVCIIRGDNEVSFADITEVDFHVIPPEGIAHYVDRYRPYDKAGAYAIQEWIGVIGIRSIHGDFYNVMGLPVSRVVSALADHFQRS
jgi:septum formation protein